MNNKPTIVKSDEDAKALADLMVALEKINIDGPIAKLNQTTISDNNGGRIYL